MAIPHAQPGDVIDISALGEKLRQTQTTTLVKTGSLDVPALIRKVLTIDPNASVDDIASQLADCGVPVSGIIISM